MFQTLLLIAEDEASRPEMKSYIGMQEQLEALLKRSLINYVFCDQMNLLFFPLLDGLVYYA